jgi:hypothetical protein
MKSIALALTLAALAAPASAFTQNSSHVTTGLAIEKTTPAQEQVSCFGPWSTVLEKASEAFRVRQIDDKGGDLDGGRRYRNAFEDTKGRNVPRRSQSDPGDSGRVRGPVDPSASGDSAKK